MVMSGYSKEYVNYLNSPVWRERRISAIERSGNKCSVCGEEDYLEVHHKTYERLGFENPNDLVVLCKAHHWMADEERKNPGFIERSRSTAEVTQRIVYCDCVELWHKKAKRVYARANEKGYFTRSAKDTLSELESKFDDHIARCLACRDKQQVAKKVKGKHERKN